MIFALLLACVPDDVPGGKDSDTSTPDDSSNHQTDDTGDNHTDDSNSQTEQSIVGDWRSDAENVAPLLQTYGVAWVEASFKGDGTYATELGDTAGKTYNLAGTYTVDTSTLPGTIVANQTSPTTVTAQGIWQVDGNTLRYEVAQTSPDQGFTPPTPEGGFGSTQGTNVQEGVNIQIYVRQ